jgi:hypothetical protein
LINKYSSRESDEITDKDEWYEIVSGEHINSIKDFEENY